MKQIGTNSASTLPKDSFCLKYKKHIDACINLAKVEDPMEAPTVEKIINTRKTNKQPRKRRYDKRVPEYNSSGTINETMESITNIYTKDFIKPVTGCSVCAQIQRMPGFTMIRIISRGFNPEESIMSPEKNTTNNINEHIDCDMKSIATSVDADIDSTSESLGNFAEIKEITQNALFVTSDMLPLQENSPHHDGILATRRSLKNRAEKQIDIEEMRYRQSPSIFHHSTRFKNRIGIGNKNSNKIQVILNSLIFMVV